MDRETYFALVAQHIPQLTNKVQHELLEVTGSYAALFESSSKEKESSDKRSNILARAREAYRASRSQLEDCVFAIGETFAENGTQVFPTTSESYPSLLKEINSAPPALFVRGAPENLHLPQIAMVGSRQMTRGGESLANQWGEFFAQSGFVVTSGLALGVDSAAHKGALQASGGRTVAVIATGTDTVYPRQHEGLAECILEAGGTNVSEFLPDTPPVAKNFPRRNRIISAFSLGVLVVEAAMKSGSLITARYALEQNREVFAIPGSIHNPQARGCHHLIKQGAYLVETAEDVVQELGGGLSRFSFEEEMQPSLPQGLSKEEKALLMSIGFDPIDLDGLCSNTNQVASELLPSLLSLELKGLVENLGGQYVRVK